MSAAAILTIFATILGVLLQAGTTIAANRDNKELVEQTNQANLESVRETNASNVEQANLAYQRSLPAQQVRDLISGGLSMPAALSKIAGGGSYQLPTLQAGTSQAAQVNYSGIGSAFERLSGIPSNVQQLKMQDAQLESLRQEMQLRKEAALRQEEQHKFDMWQKLYGKDATMSIDALSSQIVQMAADRGISLDNIESIDQLRKSFDLDNNKIWRSMPNMARTQVVDAVRSQAAENRAQQSAKDVHTAAKDAHQLSLLREALAKVDVKYYDKEKHEKLLNLMREGEGLIQRNNLTFQDVKAEEMENLVREAGIEDEAEANAIAQYAERLAAYDEATLQRIMNSSGVHDDSTRQYLRQMLRDFGNLIRQVHVGVGKYSKTTTVRRQ